PLIHVAELHVADHRTVRAAAPASVQFDVNVRLRERPAELRIQQRIEQLERDIAGKQALLDQLRIPAIEERQGALWCEPLLAFAAPKGSCPFGLRRLLVEWADHPADLGALMYAKFDADWLRIAATDAD